MAGKVRGYRDFFSQSASSSIRNSSGFANDYGFFSDAPTAPSLSTSRARMENVDLKSHVDGFLYLEFYSGYLQSEGMDGELPSLGHGARSGHDSSVREQPWVAARQARGTTTFI
jgi:hypothetical protein